MMAASKLLETLDDLDASELTTFQWQLYQPDNLRGFPAIKKGKVKNADREDTVNLMVGLYSENSLDVCKQVLMNINRNDLVQRLLNSSSPKGDVSDVGETSENRGASSSQPESKDLVRATDPPQPITWYQDTLESNLEHRFMGLQEGWLKTEDQQLLNDIFTCLYIVYGRIIQLNMQHEFRQIEMASADTEESIKPSDIFKHPSGKDIRTVLTLGIAGIGKTFLVHKFILDWCDGRNQPTNNDVHLLLHFTFRQLNSLKGKRFTLAQLVHRCIKETIFIKEEALIEIFTELQTSGNSSFRNSKFKLLFVFDGLDECRLKLDFKAIEECTIDVTESTPVEVLLTNLFNGNLLPAARVWTTTRPAAAHLIPSEFVDQVTQVRGFTDLQKEVYFRKKFRNEEQACRILLHIKNSRSIQIMCHIPIFSWITATVLMDLLEREDLPKTLTAMYTKFLLFQINQTKKKYEQDNIRCIESLAKLAFHQLVEKEGNMLFYEQDLKNSGINSTEASQYSGVFTEIFQKQEGPKDNDKTFSFVHLSIQEYMAALHVVLLLNNKHRNAMAKPRQAIRQQIFRQTSATEVHRIAVDKALKSPNGHLDLFLRFLMGLSRDSNQKDLQGLLKKTGSSSKTNEETVKYIKEKIRENPSAEASINLFHCLNELNDHSLVEEIQQYLQAESLSDSLSPAHWVALVFILLTSEEALSERSCEVLASVLNSQSSRLQDLDLSNNTLHDSGLNLICTGLKSQNCILKTLGLSGSQLSERSCEPLASVLSSRSSSLTKLDVSNNALQDSGIKRLSVGLGSRYCKVKNLSLSGCQLSEKSCEPLASVLSSHSSILTTLDLSNNALQDRGIKLISVGLENRDCGVENLNLSGCQLSERSCEPLASVLSSQSRLRRLDLSNNALQDSGVELLAVGLGHPQCRLENLSLSGCQLAEGGFASLASALSSNPLYLRELDLSYNHPGASEVALLSAGLEDQYWRLDYLSVDPDAVCWLKPSVSKCLGLVLVEYDYEYTHQNGKVISITAGERYVLIAKTNGDWWKVQREPSSFFYAPSEYMTELPGYVPWPLAFSALSNSEPHLEEQGSAITAPDEESVSHWASGEDDHVLARAEYDYTAEDEDEMSMQAGDILKLAPEEQQTCRESGWLLASLGGQTRGFVPANRVQVLGEKRSVCRWQC